MRQIMKLIPAVAVASFVVPPAPAANVRAKASRVVMWGMMDSREGIRAF